MNWRDKTLLFSLLASLFVHIATLGLRLIDKNSQLGPKKDKSEGLQVKIRDIEPQKKLDKSKNQMVNNQYEGQEKRPEETRFLGKKNQKYKEQTVPKKVGKFQKGTKQEKSQAPSKTQSKNKKVSLNDLSPTQNELNRFVNEKSPSSQKRVAQNNDYLPEIEKHGSLHLNTRQSKYWGFYNRIRQTLEPIWGSQLQSFARQTKNKRTVYRTESPLITSIRIVTDEKGHLLSLKVLNSSGLKELDEIALNSIERTAPFQNVPKGMLNANQRAKLEWRFVVN